METKTHRSGLTLSAILDTALTMTAQDGLESLTIGEVAKRGPGQPGAFVHVGLGPGVRPGPRGRDTPFIDLHAVGVVLGGEKQRPQHIRQVPSEFVVAMLLSGPAGREQVDPLQF